MMGDYHTIEVQNVGVINICFRRDGMLFNQGRVVLDIDTYDFAGRLTDDVIVGYYEDGTYHIHYYYKTYMINTDPITQQVVGVGDSYEEYHLELYMDFTIGKLPEDFFDTQIRDEDFSITFEYMEENLNVIRRTLESNRDLIVGRK